jgi:hypothetical protein
MLRGAVDNGVCERNMAPDDLEALKTGVEAVTSSALRPVTELITSIFGPAAEEAGLMLKDHVRVFRAKRQLRLYERSAEILARTGLRPQQVSLKLLFPIIENASVEESDELQDRWANLLAHAADPENADSVSISFPTILRELSTRQVRFLDALYEEAIQRSIRQQASGVEAISFGWLDFTTVFTDAGLARFPTRHHLSVAEWKRDDVNADHKERGVALDMFVRHRIMEEVYELPPRRDRDPELDSGFQFTLLGAQFVSACREPKRRAPTVIESSA